METKEYAFSGMHMNGFGMLFLDLVTYSATVWMLVMGIVAAEADETVAWAWFFGAFVMFVCAVMGSCGFVQVEPNEARVMMFFGKYVGTFTKVGFYWVNPFVNAKKLSMRARNLDAEPIKVNDKTGNPVMIGIVVVWKLKDTYKAMFEIDSQTMASNANGQIGTDTKSLMNAFENFVRIQSDAALRQVAGQYAYDDTDNERQEPTLRDGGDAINAQLKESIEERLAMAGIEVVEARLNYLAYAPEIAAVMLRRQQAAAIITAREKIVEGAVSMVKMALDKLKEDNVVELDDEKKAAMVSNLLVVLCGDDSAQPVVNTGTLNH